MPVDFDQVIDRRNTNSVKHDFAVEYNRPADVLPLWIADMDFKVAQPIIDDIHAAVEHGIFGYSEVKEDYFTPLHGWFLNHFGWDTKYEWLIKTPGVVYAIAVAIHAFTKKGDSILIQQPVYYPFMGCVVDNDRNLVNNQLVYKNGKYEIDFEDFEQKIITEHVKLFILCSPHNPVGRVWIKEELTRLGNICIKHGVIVLSDEIHCDFTYQGYQHTVFATINDTFANNSITCTSPSKVFNIAGLQIANTFIPNPALRKAFCHSFDASGYSQLNTIGLVAGKSAYEKGESWYYEMLEYLEGNLDYVRSFLADNIPKIKLIEPEGTYLIWLDCSALGLSYKELETLVVKRAKLWLDRGGIFSRETALFERINIACPRAILEQALTQLAQAIEDL